MKMLKFAVAFAIAMCVAACGTRVPDGGMNFAGGAGTKSAQVMEAGDAKADSAANDKSFNLGGSYLGDNKQMTSNIYGARKVSTPAWGGTLQAGVIQGAQSAKELKESLAAAMQGDPVLIQLVKRQEILLKQLEAATDAAASAPIQAQLDALVPLLETAMTRVHESVRVASGGDLRNLRAIIIGSMSHNGNVVGASPLDASDKEFEAYGKGFEKLPEVLQALMGDG